MKPANVTETHDEDQNLTTWTLGGQSVSFHPSQESAIRERQEHDLLVALVERQGAPAKATKRKKTVT